MAGRENRASAQPVARPQPLSKQTFKTDYREYKVLIDLRYKGNPPGQSTDFDGLCYASGVDGDSAWAAQVQPTGQVSVDRQILKSVVPVKLSTSYLEGHCVG
jgi:hypothetical protein